MKYHQESVQFVMEICYQHDNYLKHTANVVKAHLFLFWKSMDWAPQSLDIKITEAVLDHLNSEQNKRQPTLKDILWNVLQEAMKSIPEDYW